MPTKSIDNLIAFRVLYMLVNPFEKTDAFRLGIIDKDGNQLKKMKDLKSSEEKDAYNYLTKLVFKLKRLIAKVPGGSSQFASIVAAYWLVKESMHSSSVITEEEFTHTLSIIESGVTFVEEEIEIEKFIAMMEEGGAAIANTAGAATSTDQAAIRLNKKNKPISGIIGTPKYTIRRNKTNTKMG
jgi:hypothetical protein